MIESKSNLLTRILAAVLGGYALAHTLPVMLFSLLPVARSDAALWAAQLSFLVFACAIIWVFAVRTALRAWVGLAVPSVVCGLLTWWWL